MPGIAAPKPAASAPAVRPAPAAAPSKPTMEALSREDIRGISTAIAHVEVATLRDELTARLGRIEDRLAALEKKPVTPPPLPVQPIAPFVSHEVPIVVAPPATPAPVTEFTNLSHSEVDLVDIPIEFGGRRRKRVAIFFVSLLVALVAAIVIAAMVSQAMNNHSK
jgi:hypothetical protein